ncbi:MAG TPA: response regulator [Armatimonadota bacterium]
MEPLRILIVDDEPIIRLDLKHLLQNLGYQVVGEAGNGSDGIERARELRPDLCIFDVKMPEMDGIEAARILTSEKIAPVVLLTAYGQMDLVQRASEAGVSAYIVKPFKEADLVPAIEIALSRWRELKDLESQVGSLQNALETRKLVEKAKGILMEKHSLKESEAFRRMQQQSMRARKSMKEIAEAILLVEEV